MHEADRDIGLELIEHATDAQDPALGFHEPGRVDGVADCDVHAFNFRSERIE
jgi:hypothetical protein